MAPWVFAELMMPGEKKVGEKAGNPWHKDTGREARWGIQECEDWDVSGQPKHLLNVRKQHMDMLLEPFWRPN